MRDTPPMRWMFAGLLLAGCSLTPIPDVTSEFVPVCDPAQRVCPVDFTLPGDAGTSVELRGDFTDGGWDLGVPMALDGGVFNASVTAPWGADVQYKFLVDSNRWILDPANPESVPDGKGNTNSILRGVSCAKWTCAGN
jgi:hypothetical protein